MKRHLLKMFAGGLEERMNIQERESRKISTSSSLDFFLTVLDDAEYVYK